MTTLSSGMETSDHLAQHLADGPLETFLSGMETEPQLAVRDQAGDLETFLSGMETIPGVPQASPRRPLKPSLVEWKLGLDLSRCLPVYGLETFLSGMEKIGRAHV